MSPSRRTVLASVFVALALLTTVVLFEVFGTVFFAMTIAYVLAPVQRALRERGVPQWWAAAATTVVGILGVLAVFAPLFVVAYVRREELLGALRSLPAEIAVDVPGYTGTISLAEVQSMAVTALGDAVPRVLLALVPLTVKGGLFLLVLFALLLNRGKARRATLSVVPPAYHDVVAALADRAADTLYAIYVLQAATGLATFLIALPVFWALGYQFPFGLAVVAGVLQFLPVVGPSVLIGSIALYHVALGQPVAAALVVLVAGVLVALLPDLLVRPRLARRTANMPGSLYFVGFTGGAFSLGAIGIVAGPVIVALFDESVSLLADELDTPTDTALAEELGVEDGSPDDGDPLADGGPGTGDDLAPDSAGGSDPAASAMGDGETDAPDDAGDG